MEKIRFLTEYRARAHRLGTFAIAGQWMRLAAEIPTLTASEAAAWADLGYMPAEAEPSIRSGITAAMTAEMERHAETQAGGADALAAERIAAILSAEGWEDARPSE